MVSVPTQELAVDDLAEEVLAQAKACGVTIVTAESCSGGLLAGAFSRSPGAGDGFHGGFVTYSKDMKTAVLGVPRELMKRKTAVCEEVALALASGALERSPATAAIAVTGVAGPKPDEDGNPVGLVYCAVRHNGRHGPVERVMRLQCRGETQAAILEETMRRALQLFRDTCLAG